MNKFQIGDKVVYDRDNPDYVFEIDYVPQTITFTHLEPLHYGEYRFKDCKDPYEKEFIETDYRLATQEEIDAMWKKQEQDEHDSKTQSQTEIVCPYCFNIHNEEDADGFNFKYICDECDEVFSVEKNIEITYSTSKYES